VQCREGRCQTVSARLSRRKREAWGRMKRRVVIHLGREVIPDHEMTCRALSVRFRQFCFRDSGSPGVSARIPCPANLITAPKSPLPKDYQIKGGLRGRTRVVRSHLIKSPFPRPSRPLDPFVNTALTWTSSFEYSSSLPLSLRICPSWLAISSASRSSSSSSASHSSLTFPIISADF